MSIQIRTDGEFIKSNGTSQRFIQVSLEAPPAAAQSARPPINLAFVIDRSGSMQGAKIVKAREAVIHGIGSLRDGDRFSVVTFDHEVEVIVASTVSTAAGRQNAIAAVRRIEPRGRTNLCGGWLQGCSEIGEHLANEAMGRCILLTDGLTNEGIIEIDEIIGHVKAMRERLVSTSALGIGTDFNEFLLGRMAEAGGGNFHFIENANEIPNFIAAEVGEALAVTAREVEIHIETSSALSVESLNDFPCRREANTWHIAAGSLYAGQLLEPVIGITFPTGTIGGETLVNIRVADRDSAFGTPLPPVRFRWAPEAQHRDQKLDSVVAASVANLLSARTVREALVENHAGNYGTARETVFKTLSNIHLYAGSDPAVHAIELNLRSKIGELSQVMDPGTRKTEHMHAYSRSKGRGIQSPRQSTSGIVLFPTAGEHSFIEQIVPMLGEAAPYLFGDLAFDSILAAGALQWRHPPDVLRTREESHLLNTVKRHASRDQIGIAVVDQRLADNWFSHWHAEQRCGVVSLAGWDGHFEVSARAFVAYEVVLYGLAALSPAYDSVAIAHDETRGCLFDFCETRADIEVKLQTADLCPDCRRNLEDIGIQVSRLLPLTRLIRDLATPIAAH